MDVLTGTLLTLGFGFLVASKDRVLVGATGLYEARCRHCFDPHLAEVEKTT